MSKVSKNGGKDEQKKIPKKSIKQTMTIESGRGDYTIQCNKCGYNIHNGEVIQFILCVGALNKLSIEFTCESCNRKIKRTSDIIFNGNYSKLFQDVCNTCADVNWV